jgi:ubiquinone/menaquinone biosynthesis C-methylase UbiE
MSADTVIIKRDERHWQDSQGGSLQQRAYARAGTQIVMQRQFMRVANALNLQPGIRLLDLGCGAGIFLSWLARQMEGKYYGIDLSLNSAQSAKELSTQLSLAVGDAEVLPYKNESFDRISCNGAAHHLLDLHSALAEMFRILAPGGILALYEPTSTRLTNAVRNAFVGFDKYESPADLAHKEEFTSQSVKSTLLKVGFRDIVASRHDFLAYPLSGMYIDLPLSRSAFTMKFLTHVEQKLSRIPLATPLLNLFSWRLLVVAVKPNTAK